MENRSEGFRAVEKPHGTHNPFASDFWDGDSGKNF